MAKNRKVIPQRNFYPRGFWQNSKVFEKYLRSSVVGGFIDWLRSFSTLLRASLTVSIWPLMLLKNFLFPSSPSSPLRPSAAVWKTLDIESKFKVIWLRTRLTCWNHAGAGWVLGGCVVCLRHLKNRPFPLNTFCPQKYRRISEVVVLQKRTIKWMWRGSRRFNTIMLMKLLSGLTVYLSATAFNAGQYLNN